MNSIKINNYGYKICYTTVQNLLLAILNFSALRPKCSNFLASVRNEVAAFRRRRAEK